MMKISTQLMFDRGSSQMSTVQNKLTQTQAQLAQGKQVINASDAPDQAATIQRLKSILNRQDSYQSSLNTVKNRMQGEESTLQSVSDLLVRAKEVAVQGANDTLNPGDRKALATEMQALRDQMLSLGEQRSIPINRTGTDAFVPVARIENDGTSVGVGFFKVRDDLIIGLNESKGPLVRRGVGELDALQQGVSLAQAEVGTNLNVVDQQTAVIEDTTLNLKTTLSSIEDLDYASAISKMSQQMLSLEAAQSSFAKVSQLSLFNFIK